MAKRSALARLDDLLQAIGDIETIVGRLDVQTFQADFVARLAIERCLEIISEASRHIPVRLTDNYPAVPWADIRAIGNRLRHECDRVDSAIIWKTATSSVPDLKSVIHSMIASLESDEAP